MIGPNPGGAITIIYWNSDGHCRGRSRRPRGRVSIRLARRLLRRKITPCYEILYTEGFPGPPQASDVPGDDDVGPCVDANGAE